MTSDRAYNQPTLHATAVCDRFIIASTWSGHHGRFHLQPESLPSALFGAYSPRSSISISARVEVLIKMNGVVTMQRIVKAQNDTSKFLFCQVYTSQCTVATSRSRIIVGCRIIVGFGVRTQYHDALRPLWRIRSRSLAKTTNVKGVTK